MTEVFSLQLGQIGLVQLELIIDLLLMSESIGAIKVPALIWTSTILTLGALGICWATTKIEHATILESALQYPYTIIFRIGMMYSLFIYFLEFLFIKWWIDNMPIAKHTTKMAVVGTVGLAAYGLFVACIDRKRINYQLAEFASFAAAICITYAIFTIMRNLSKNRAMGLALADEKSWFYKKLFSFTYFSGFTLAALIYSGEVDVHYKVISEYTCVISAILFMWSFSIDFKKFKMDVQKIEKPSQQNISCPMYQ